MDLVGACRVFIQVSERGSFTVGAAAARVPQSVASRRVAALEAHLGARLFDRSVRRAALTAFGREMLAPAKRLVRLADALEYNAEQARLSPVAVALPDACSVRRLAVLDGAARAAGLVLDVRTAPPADRLELLRTHQVRVALVAVVPDEARWTVRLGVASAADPDGAPWRVETLRPSRAAPAVRRMWIQPEDDVPHVRDRLERLGHRAALAPAQLAVAPSMVAAVSDTLRTDNLLLCSSVEADELGLSWRPLAGRPFARGYRAVAVPGEDARRFGDGLHEEVARCLGASNRA